MNRWVPVAAGLVGLVMIGGYLFLSREEQPRQFSSRPEYSPPVPDVAQPASPAVAQTVPAKQQAAASAPIPATQPPVNAPSIPMVPVVFLPRASVGSGVNLVPGARELTEKLNDSAEPPEHDIEILNEVFATYRRVTGSNPAGGENVELVNSLAGENVKKLSVLPSDLRAFNAGGELVDRWGTAFHFHPVSQETIEVLSAGPDRLLWTKDDVGVLRPDGAE